MPNTNNRYYSNPQPYREGASHKDVWKLYNILPINSHFTLEFYHDGDPNCLERIAFLKCGNELEYPMTVQDHEEEMRAAFRKYGYEGFRSLIFQWNRGFGNSILCQVVIYPDKSLKGGSN